MEAKQTGENHELCTGTCHGQAESLWGSFLHSGTAACSTVSSYAGVS